MDWHQNPALPHHVLQRYQYNSDKEDKVNHILPQYQLIKKKIKSSSPHIIGHLGPKQHHQVQCCLQSLHRRALMVAHVSALSR